MKKRTLRFKESIFDPTDLVAYSKGTIVSRTIVERKAGTLTVFAFDRGQGLSEHVAPYDAVVQILEGSAVIFVASHKLQVKAGSMVIMPANVPHAVRAERRFKMLLYMVHSR